MASTPEHPPPAQQNPLGWFERKLRGEPGRRTRFHTHRGDLIAPGDWPRVPLQVWRGLRDRLPAEPWIAPPAMRWLRRRLDPSWDALELGAGNSTVWLARRVGTLISVESDSEWAERVRGQVEAAEIEGWRLERLPIEEMPRFVSTLADRSFDLILVDHTDVPGASRADSVEAAREKVRPGGWLVLDDSDRERYRRVDELLAGWELRRFAGMKARPVGIAVETSVYTRPPDS
jgi:SAM-dependent methyltransferase